MHNSDKEMNLISIIIPTHKGRNISKCLESIDQSTFNNFEVIVVDEGKERSAQRNIGVKRSKGEYLLFLDSDMTIHSFLLQECIYLVKCYDGLYIPEIIVGHPIKTFFRSFYNGTRVDAIRFLRKEFFIPFDENITGFEDWDFDRRFRGKKEITSFPLYHHHKGKSNKLYYTKWLSIYKKKYPNCPELSLKYRLFTVFVENGKWKKFFGIKH